MRIVRTISLSLMAIFFMGWGSLPVKMTSMTFRFNFDDSFAHTEKGYCNMEVHIEGAKEEKKAIEKILITSDFGQIQLPDKYLSAIERPVWWNEIFIYISRSSTPQLFIPYGVGGSFKDGRKGFYVELEKNEISRVYITEYEKETVYLLDLTSRSSKSR